MTFDKEQFEKLGFAEISAEDGMVNAAQASEGCSGERSDCCTRVCKAGDTSVGTPEAWEQFLSVKGGQIQY